MFLVTYSSDCVKHDMRIASKKFPFYAHAKRINIVFFILRFANALRNNPSKLHKIAKIAFLLSPINTAIPILVSSSLSTRMLFKAMNTAFAEIVPVS